MQLIDKIMVWNTMSCKATNHDTTILEKKNCLSIFSSKTSIRIVKPTIQRGSGMGILIWTNVNVHYLGILVYQHDRATKSSVILNEAIFKDICYICSCNLPYYDPNLTSETMNWTNLKLPYVKKLLCKFQLSWTIGFEQMLRWLHPIFFSIWLIVSNLKVSCLFLSTTWGGSGEVRNVRSLHTDRQMYTHCT